MTDADLSRVRNAARDMANAYVAFEKAGKRLGEATRACGGVTGPRSSQIVIAVQQGCDSPHRAAAFNAIRSRLEVVPPGSSVLDSEPVCRCGASQWVSVSLNRGATRIRQCVPCGAYGPAYAELPDTGRRERRG